MHAESAGTHGQGPEHGRAGASVLASTGTRAYASSTPQKQPAANVAVCAPEAAAWDDLAGNLAAKYD